MKDGKIVVLQVIGGLSMGGAESRIMDHYRHIDRSKVQFDFLVHTEADIPDGGIPSSEHLCEVRKPDFYDSEVLSLGGRIYALPRYRLKTAAKYKRAVRLFFSTHGGWAAVEGHMTSLAAVYLPIAKECGVPHTIAHVRSGGVAAGLKGAATKWMRRSLPAKAEILLSCARDAGVQAILFLPEDSCVIPTGKEHRIIRKLTELAENTEDGGRPFRKD